MRSAVVLALFAVFFAAAFGLRTLIHLRRTGSTGWKGISGRVGSIEWWGGALFAAALILGVLAPVLAATILPPVRLPPGTDLLGALLYALGLVGTLVAQLAMGASWRIGVDAAERTQLVTGGAFRLVRNPIFTCMLVAALGLALLLPNVLSLLSVALLLVAVELQVRLVEEPYLLRTHGTAYARYAASVGRFIPGLGLLR